MWSLQWDDHGPVLLDQISAWGLVAEEWSHVFKHGSGSLRLKEARSVLDALLNMTCCAPQSQNRT